MSRAFSVYITHEKWKKLTARNYWFSKSKGEIDDIIAGINQEWNRYMWTKKALK